MDIFQRLWIAFGPNKRDADVAQAITSAMWLVRSSDRWVKFRWDDDVCFCIIGALRELGLTPDYIECVAREIVKHLPFSYRRRFIVTPWSASGVIIHFNDNEATTYADVKRVLGNALNATATNKWTS